MCTCAGCVQGVRWLMAKEQRWSVCGGRRGFCVQLVWRMFAQGSGVYVALMIAEELRSSLGSATAVRCLR